MANSLKLIKNLKNEPTIYQLLSSFIFGDRVVEPYDSTKTYNTNDLITVKNTVTGNVEVLQCKHDGVTGPYNSSDWEKSSVAEVALSGGSKMISFSATKPTDRANILWFREKNTRTLNVPNSFFE